MLGIRCTVTVMLNGALAQVPTVDVAVTLYTTVPEVELLRFVKV